jgi:biopolymer transport protein ExbD
MKRKKLYSEGDSMEEINISPLIDIVFILLIFFIVTAVFTRDNSIDVDRPQAMSAKEVDTIAISISITKDGKVYYEGQEIGVRGVRATVRRQMRKKERPVVVMVDKRAHVGMYAMVHDEASFAGAKIVSMATNK